jgi:2-polyprenyl-3-methyl-5-hydroxy-6-metoxy-1,4-benzoquinol methylase
MRVPEYLKWCDRLKCRDEAERRKVWEYCYILQGLGEQLGFGEPRRGLGFGVGKDRLAETFASFGCSVVATDQDPIDAARAGWIDGNQYASSIEELNRLKICPPELFAERVQFRVVDMNRIPEDLTNFDFVWSACALEHLGSIEQGLAFIENAMKCVRPGGVAVHTTEFNLTSDEETLDSGPTVLFRARDLANLAGRLARQGCRMLPLNLHPGRGAIDHHVDVPPYPPTPHCRLLIDRYAATSLGILVIRGDA